MNYYKLTFDNGDIKIVKANSDRAVVNQYDLATREHIGTTFKRLYGDEYREAQNCESIDCDSNWKV